MAAPSVTNNYETHNSGARSIRSIHQAWAADCNFVAANDGTPTLVALKTSHTIYVTLISISVTTDNAATLTFQDSASTAIIIAKTKASPGVGPILFDFGELGIPLTEAKNFNMAISAAGLAGHVHAEGYFKRTAVAAA